MPDREKNALPAPAPDGEAGIASLLAAIEREPVPARLLELARALQEALRTRSSGTPGG